MKNLTVLLCLIVFSSCMRDDALWERNQNQFTPNESAYKGVFVLNEGNFNADNASLSYYNIDSLSIHNNIFFNENALRLGDVAHSITVHNELAFIVANNSGKIQIMNNEDFSFTGKITGLTSPRYMKIIDENKAYVTDLYAKKIWIVDPLSHSISGSINTDNGTGDFFQHSTEQIVLWQDFALVNCWSFDNQILWINTSTDTIQDSVRVIKQPNSMVIDRNDRLWVLSDGGYDGSPYGQVQGGLQCIDLATRNIVFEYRFEIDESPGNLKINSTRDTLFFINNHVYKMSITENVPQEFITSNYSQNTIGGFNGIGIHPMSNELYIADAKDFNQPGSVFRYSAGGRFIDEFRVGIIPSEIVFK